MTTLQLIHLSHLLFALGGLAIGVGIGFYWQHREMVRRDIKIVVLTKQAAEAVRLAEDAVHLTKAMTRGEAFERASERMAEREAAIAIAMREPLSPRGKAH
jgi:hypothetical protein